MAEKNFPIVIFDSTSVMQLLYSCAYARAAAMDALVVDEPTVLNSLVKYAPTPKRIGSLTEGDPMAFRRAVLMIYLRYQSGYNAALGTGGALTFLRSCTNVRNDARARLQGLHAFVSKNNATFDEGLTHAFHAANDIRYVCTVALATGALIAGTPGALIFLSYKAVNAYAPDITTLMDRRTNVGFAVGKYENGVISVGEVSQELMNRGIAGTASAYRRYIASEISKNRQIIVELERSIATNSAMLLKLLKHGSLSASQKAALTHFGSSLSSSLPKLQSARAASGLMVGEASTMRTFLGKAVPIVFLANDIISAQNEWYDAEQAFDQGRNTRSL
jgi:hypothetical protein